VCLTIFNYFSLWLCDCCIRFFVLRVACFNIYNVFVDSSRKGDAAVDLVIQGLCGYNARFIILKISRRNDVSNCRTSLYHRMTATGGAMVTVARLLRLRLLFGVALCVFFSTFHCAQLP
jgi:hypothetical protein